MAKNKIYAAHDAEDDARIEIEDGGARSYGVDLTVWEGYGTDQITICISKALLLGLMNQVSKEFRAQGYRAKRLQDNDDFELSIKESDLEESD